MLSVMDGAALRDRIRDLTVAGKPCTAPDMAETRKIVDCLIDCLREKAHTMIRSNTDGACMIAYASDGWSGSIQSMTRASDGHHLVVTRRGKRRHEFLLERAFVRTLRPDGTHHMKVLLDRPRGLGAGKTAWNMFSGAIEFVETLRVQGCRGVSIQFYCMDKLHHGAFTRYMRGRHALQYREEFSALEADEPLELLECLEWVVSVPCKAHGCSNAVVWSLKHLGDEALVKDAHISIASLRNGADALHGKVDRFLQHCVAFVDRPHSRQDVQLFWGFLGIPLAWRQLFVDADPVWDGRVLAVSSAFGESKEAYDRLRLLVLYCLRWYNWSETRWLGVRKSARFYLRSLVVGVARIVKLVGDDPCESAFHLNGHSKSTPDVRRYLAIASVSAAPAEDVHQQILIDDRFMRFGAEMRRKVPEALARICADPQFLWVRLSFLVGGDSTAESIRHDCIHVASVCCGYLERDVFATLDRPPAQPHPGVCVRQCSPGR